MIVRKLVQISLKRVEGFVALRLSPGSGHRVRRVPAPLISFVAAGRCVQRVGPAFAAALEPGLAVLHLVVDDPAEPSPELRLAAKLVKLLETNQENLLRKIVSFLAVLDSVERPAPDAILEMNDETLERLPVPRLSRRHPFGNVLIARGCGTRRVRVPDRSALSRRPIGLGLRFARPYFWTTDRIGLFPRDGQN